MMDRLCEFGDEFNVAQVAGTYLFTNQIDSQIVMDLGNGKPVYLVISVGATAVITGGSAGTLQFRLVSDTAAAISATLMAVHAASGLFVTDDIALTEFTPAGKMIWNVALPTDGAIPYRRFLGVQALVATTTITAGTINAYLALDPDQGVRHYADASN